MECTEIGQKNDLSTHFVVDTEVIFASTLILFRNILR